MDLINTPQNLTADWVNLGEPINMTEYSKAGIWPEIDINDSLDVRLRAVAKLNKLDDITVPYLLPIKAPSLNETSVSDLYYEFIKDTDQKLVLEIETDNLIPHIQLQVMAGTVGVTPGQIDSCKLTFAA